MVRHAWGVAWGIGILLLVLLLPVLATLFCLARRFTPSEPATASQRRRSSGTTERAHMHGQEVRPSSGMGSMGVFEVVMCVHAYVLF